MKIILHLNFVESNKQTKLELYFCLLASWLSKTLPIGSRVGVDPRIITYQDWTPLKTQLELAGHKLVPISQNLIDLIWKDRPKTPCNPVKPLPIQYSGKAVAAKLADVRQHMKEKNASVLVITALDEIAWLLNLRGSDIDYNPVFFAYVIVQLESCLLFIDPKKYTKDVAQHLKEEAPNEKFIIKQYEDVEKALKELTQNLVGRVWLSESASYALISAVPQKTLYTDVTPTALMKAVKNSVEIEGMRNAHIKDAAALCCYFAWLEKNVQREKITEITGAEKLEEFRKQQADYVGASFGTISSVGPHGAIIHYTPDAKTDAQLTVDALYLCDSGGQYLDGTTDVTRTLHFGTPSDYEKECFTRVLKGQLQLAASVFPTKIKGNYLDSFARQFLWKVGLNYGHGTGHGIGSYLCVHESPIGISWRHLPDDPGLEEGMFLSNEPGYYEDGKFGIRLEDIIQIVKATVPYDFNNRGYLTCDTITLVPKQIKMIAVELLTDEEITLLNEYHEKCRNIIGPLLEQQGQFEAKEWLWKETEPIKRN